MGLDDVETICVPGVPLFDDEGGGPSSSSDVNQTLPMMVDEVERRLGMALKAYRQRAEEILDRHFEAMQKVQLGHDLEVSTLKAENFKLREVSGTKNFADASPQQNVLFQTMSAPAQDPGTRRKDIKQKASRGTADDDNSTVGVSKRGLTRNKTSRDNSAAGGSWQQFVAWVPNGAGLQNPEPWKPLPQPSGSPVGLAGKRTNGNLNQFDSSSSFVGVMPGGRDESAAVVRTESKTKMSDDSDSDVMSNDSNKGSAKLELLSVWNKTTRENKRLTKGRISIDSESPSQPSTSCDFPDYVPRHGFIINPDAGIRIAWDLTSLLMVIYDMIMIPMIAFQIPDNLFEQVMDWTTRLFWTFDMAWSCCTGVILDDGTVEYNFRIIVVRYLKSWFGLDLFIVGSDWGGLIFSSGGVGLSKLARVSRVVRVVRLLRLVRMQEVIANITERIQSDNVVLLLKVVKLLVFLMGVCHVIACGWFGIGDRTTAERTWVSQYGYGNADIRMQYLVSLHWSLAQFAGGSEEILPLNGYERFYCVFTWVFAFMAGLVMLSFLTSSLTQQYIISGSGARQMATLKKYLNQNKVPKNLAKRLCRNAKHAVSGDLTPDAVDLLVVVSDPLKIEMHYEMYSQILKHHDFFHDLLQWTPTLMRRVCHEAMSMLLLAVGDVVFSKGEEPPEPKMYFVVSGSLQYEDVYGEKCTLVEKQFIGEPALWCNWAHKGELTACCDAKLAVLDSGVFQDICAMGMKKRTINFSPKDYAARYITELNQTAESTDLPMKAQILHSKTSMISDETED